MRFPRKKLSSVLIKPAGPDCNLACTYCFYLKNFGLFSGSKIHRMTEDVLEEVIRQVMVEGERHLSFSWQGGEPTLMGLRFFEKAVGLQQRQGRCQFVGNGLQTNGILIDKNWAKFLNKYSFLVGLSLDGPEPIHDRYRRFSNGQGSWAKTVDRAKLLLDSGVEVNALTVLNDYSVQFPEEIYEFHKSLGLRYLQFIPCVELNPDDPARTAPFSVSPEKYGEFLCKLFNLWLSDFADNSPSTSIRFFDSVFHSYAGLPPPECTLLPECGVYVVVEYNGDVYSCDFFVEPGWKLGNVMENRLMAMLNSREQDRFGQRKANLPRDCKECGWLQYCRGGCPKDRLHNPRNKELNFLCQSYKMFFRQADVEMKKMAESWKSQHSTADSQEIIGTGPDTKSPKKIGRNDPCPCGSGLKYKKCCGKFS